jgi:hypothetical protein
MRLLALVWASLEEEEAVKEAQEVVLEALQRMLEKVEVLNPCQMLHSGLTSIARVLA